MHYEQFLSVWIADPEHRSDWLCAETDEGRPRGVPVGLGQGRLVAALYDSTLTGLTISSYTSMKHSLAHSSGRRCHRARTRTAGLSCTSRTWRARRQAPRRRGP